MQKLAIFGRKSFKINMLMIKINDKNNKNNRKIRNHCHYTGK